MLCCMFPVMRVSHETEGGIFVLISEEIKNGSKNRLIRLEITRTCSVLMKSNRTSQRSALKENGSQSLESYVNLFVKRLGMKL